MRESSKHDADLEITRKALRGDTAARDELSERLVCISPFLLALNARMGRPLSRDELVDTAQDIMVLVLGKLDTYAGDAALETWVHRFCAFELLNAIRRKDRWRERSRELVAEDAEHSDRPVLVDDPSLETLVRHLSAREAEVVELRHVDDLDLERVAQVLGVSINTAKTHYYRALKKLKAVLTTGRRGEQR